MKYRLILKQGRRLSRLGIKSLRFGWKYVRHKLLPDWSPLRHTEPKVEVQLAPEASQRVSGAWLETPETLLAALKSNLRPLRPGWRPLSPRWRPCGFAGGPCARLKASKSWLEVPEACLEVSEAWQETLEAWLEAL